MTADRRTRPRKQPVQQRAAETRERILEAAARVFAEHGYSAGTTNRIAAAAGLSIGSLYQYFPNKDSILLELTRAHVFDGMAHVADVLAVLPEGLEHRLRAVVGAMLENHADSHRLHQVLFEEAPRPPAFLAEVAALERQAIDQVATMLAGDPEVRVGDPHLAAKMVVTTVESLVHRFIAREPDTLDVDVFAEELVMMLVRYLRG